MIDSTINEVCRKQMIISYRNYRGKISCAVGAGVCMDASESPMCQSFRQTVGKNEILRVVTCRWRLLLVGGVFQGQRG